MHELSDRTHVISHDLQNLAPEDGVSLLKSWKVHGSETELEKAVKEYGCHALSLHLLGNALHTYLDGDVRKRDTLSELIDDYDDVGRNAFRVMQAYSRWLEGTPDLQLLHLLGLFDHPIETEVLQVLWQAQIPKLTAGIPEKAWKVGIRDLREKHRMLSAHEGRPDLLDCHPLIREYFGGQLQVQQPQAWQQAHERLYEYYKALPEKELPDTLEEMQPLFSAVAHGCAAGLHQQALEEVYWLRIQRKSEQYLTRRIGAFSDDLATLTHFFAIPWNKPAAGLADEWQANVLTWAGFRLHALGRLLEAVEPMQVSLEILLKRKDSKQIAIQTSNLSESLLTLGYVALAVNSAAKSVEYADKSGDMFQRTARRASHADTLHQAGQATQALKLFQEAEALQQEWQPSYPRLYSSQGYRYCDLLLAQGNTKEVLERTKQSLNWGSGQYGLLDSALDQLSLGIAYLQQGDTQQASDWLEQAVAGLRVAGIKDMLPRGLLARVAFFRYTHDFARARQDLQEVFDIANGGGMRLHLTDYHLEMARLLLAEAKKTTLTSLSAIDTLQYHTAAAQRLIEETGYHRRDVELVDLQKQLTSIPKYDQSRKKAGSMTKIFISYSHDSQPHRAFVRGLADQFRTDGLECLIDQYINGFPPEGWLRWMENQIEAADFVLLVCTETYLRRYRGQETDGGRGVAFEGVVISQTLYDAYHRNTKFVPVLPEGGDFGHVPLPLKQYTAYTLPKQYDSLYRYLTGQPEYIAPAVGGKRVMPPAQGASTVQTSTPAPTPVNTLGSVNAERRARLQEKLRQLYASYDLETRVDERMRLEAVIETTQKDLQGL